MNTKDTGESIFKPVLFSSIKMDRASLKNGHLFSNWHPSIRINIAAL